MTTRAPAVLKTPPSVQGTKMIIKRMQSLDRRKHNLDFYTSLYQELDSQEYVQFHRTQQHRLDTLVTFHHCHMSSGDRPHNLPLYAEISSYTELFQVQIRAL